MASNSAAERVSGPRDADRLRALREAMRAATLRPEPDAVRSCCGLSRRSRARLERCRSACHSLGGGGARRQALAAVGRRMLEQFPLDSAQGKALMSLAEALLRTPDPKRADQLIAERLAPCAQAGVPGDTDLLLRTGFTLLGAAGRLLPDVAAELSGGSRSPRSRGRWSLRWCARRCASRCRCSGEAFIVGETIERRSRAASPIRSWRCALSTCWAKARAPKRTRSVTSTPTRTPSRRSAPTAGASPCALRDLREALGAGAALYAAAERARARRLVPRMLELARSAARAGIGITIDAEEADRLDLSLDIIEALARERRRATGTASVSRCRPTAAARRWSSTGSRSSRARPAGA